MGRLSKDFVCEGCGHRFTPTLPRRWKTMDREGVKVYCPRCNSLVYEYKKKRVVANES